jgi:hypothetical protein
MVLLWTSFRLRFVLVISFFNVRSRDECRLIVARKEASNRANNWRKQWKSFPKIKKLFILYGYPIIVVNDLDLDYAP